MNINRIICRGYTLIPQSLLLISSKPTITIHQNRPASTFMRFRSWYRSKFGSKGIKPPFNHVCQVGDPVLRQAAERVPPQQISSKEIQKVITTLRKVMKEYDVGSLSAPQIGVPLQIFVMELNKETFEKYPEQLRKILKVSIIPPKVIINPVVKVLDYAEETYFESCPSVRGYSADVSRFARLKITAWDENAEKKEWETSGYECRVIQHEMDHFAGLLFTDRMDPRTLTCGAWEAVNQYQGKVYISYWPKKKRQGWFGNIATVNKSGTNS